MRIALSRIHVPWLVLALAALAGALGITWGVTRSRGSDGGDSVAVAQALSTTRLIDSLVARLDSRPDDPRTYSLLGSAYLQRARETGDPAYYTLADSALTRTLSLDPSDVDVLVGLGSLALTRHEFRQGVDWGMRAQRLNPDKAAVYGVLGDGYVNLGRYPEAEAAFQRMVDLRPDLSSLSRVSYFRELHGDVPGAIEAMKRAIAAGAPAAESANWSRVQLGNLYFGVGDLTNAQAQYQEALRYMPGYIHADAALARLAAARGDYGEAIATYRKVVDRIPYPEYLIALGDTQAVAGRAQDAAKTYALVHVEARLYQANGQNTDLEMALFDADHGQDLGQALQRAQRVYDQRPSIQASDVLAWTLYRAGQYTEAARYASEALRLGTRDALMLFHAGMISQKLGDVQTAKVYLEQALALNPHFPVLYKDEAAQTLVQLKRG